MSSRLETAVAVTEAILPLSSEDEPERVPAHVNKRHVLIGSVAATLAGAIMTLARTAGFSTCALRGEPCRCAHVYRQPPDRGRGNRPFQHASSH